ncbi:hypothetical protein CUZ95_0074 [Enterococcus lactis]|nr:hypothetical protein [Enterococcus lactis]
MNYHSIQSKYSKKKDMFISYAILVSFILVSMGDSRNF